MGVTLHYKGTLKSSDLIDEITNELVDIAIAKGWDYKVISPRLIKEDSSEIDLNLTGVITGPENSEPITMTFIKSGRLVSPMLSVFPPEDIQKFLDEDDFFTFTKTQDAGVDGHVEIVKLLKYLSSKYFETWECKDDSEYYSTGDIDKLEETMDMIERAMTALDDAFLEHGDSLDKENPQEMIDFISSVLGVEDIEVKIVNATIDEEGIQFIDENAALEELLNDAAEGNEASEDDHSNSDDKHNNDDADDIDLSDLLDMPE